MIRATDLHKTFRRKGAKKKEARLVAVEDVSFVAEDGLITGLLGPNGAGKSTTLRMLATLMKPDRGSATIDGFDIFKNPLAVRKNIGFMPHNAGIYPRLSARENIRYYAQVCGMAGTTLEKRIDALVDILDIHDFKDRRADGFSQGQRTKVAIARALVHEPKTLMLDEPTNGLDVMATRNLREVLRRLRDQGHCILFSSHIMHEVAALCDHIAIISEGAIAMTDSPANIRTRTGQDDFEDAFVVAIGEEIGEEIDSMDRGITTNQEML